MQLVVGPGWWLVQVGSWSRLVAGPGRFMVSKIFLSKAESQKTNSKSCREFCCDHFLLSSFPIRGSWRSNKIKSDCWSSWSRLVQLVQVGPAGPGWSMVSKLFFQPKIVQSKAEPQKTNSCREFCGHHFLLSRFPTRASGCSKKIQSDLLKNFLTWEHPRNLKHLK